MCNHRVQVEVRVVLFLLLCGPRGKLQVRLGTKRLVLLTQFKGKGAPSTILFLVRGSVMCC